MIDEGSLHGGSTSIGRMRARARDRPLGSLVDLPLPETAISAAKILPTFVAEPLGEVWEIVLEVESRPGVLIRAQASIAAHGLTVVSGQSFTPGEGGRTGFRCLVHPSASASKEATLSVLLAIPGVIDASVEESQDGFLIATGFPLLSSSGSRLAAFNAPHLARLFCNLRNLLRSGGTALLYKQGELLGEQSWTDYIQRIGRPHVLHELGYMLRLYETMGWGRVELVSVDRAEGTAEVRVRDNFECLGVQEWNPVCHFFRGHLAGAFSALWQVGVDCFEEECSAQGHPACTYRISIRRQAPSPPTDALYS